MNAGPLGGSTNRPKNDEGTHWVQASPTPSPLGVQKSPASGSLGFLTSIVMGATLGCSNQFKDVETAAYQALLQSIAEAERLTKEEISAIEKEYKRRLLVYNSRYLRDLNNCGNDSYCTETAKTDNDKWVGRLQVDHDNDIYEAQDKEATAKENAHENYDAEVKKAKQLYCR